RQSAHPAPALSEHLRGARLRVSSTGTAGKAGLHHTCRSRTDARNRTLDRERTLIGAGACMIFSKIPGVAGRHAPALPADSGVSESGSKSEEGRSNFDSQLNTITPPMVASLDRKRLGQILGASGISNPRRFR